MTALDPKSPEIEQYGLTGMAADPAVPIAPVRVRYDLGTTALLANFQHIL